MDELSNRVPKVVAWELALFSHIFLASRKRTRSAKHVRRGKARTNNACSAGQKKRKNSARFAGYKLCYRNKLLRSYLSVYISIWLT